MDLDNAEKETFIDEVSERLQQFGDSLLDFEKDPGNRNALNQLFRVAHTIKGNAGFVGLDNMVGTAHEAENLLMLLRDGKIGFDPAMAGLLFECSDMLRAILDAFIADTDTALINAQPLTARINHHVQNAMGVDAEKSETADESGAAGLNFEIKIKLKSETALPGMRAYLVRSKLMKVAEILSETPHVDQYDNQDFDGLFAFTIRTDKDEEKLRRAVRNHEIESLEIRAVSDAVQASEGDNREDAPADAGDVLFVNNPDDDARAETGVDATGRSRGDATDILRVSTRKVDDILNLVGELLSANSAYLALAAEFRSQFGNKGLYGYFRENSEELARVGAELQEKVMKVRMIPIGTVFSRFRRVTRDYNTSTPEKHIDLILRGETTEIDKYQIEGIHDPLMHLVRNAMDHGIETREARIAAGKPEAGVITLDSYQSGNNIFIEVKDDGGGLKLESIRRKVLEHGLVSADEIGDYSESRLLDFIFVPGFSTSETVSEISGRGVGMDIVRKNIEAMSGTIEVDSRPGQGTSFLIRLPLSMAIITALKVTVGEHLFALPIGVILETIKILEKDVAIIDKVESVVVREIHIPLLRLERELGILKSDNRTVNGREKKKPVVIVQYSGARVGLMVDDLLGYEDMVIKSLSRNYEEVEGLAGASILGKGEICLILDVQKLVDAIMGKTRISGTAARMSSSVPLPAPAAPATAPPIATIAAKTPEPTKVSPATAAPTIAPRSVAPAATSTSAPTPTGASGRLGPEQIALLKKIISTGRKSALNAVRELTGNNAISMKFTTTRIQSLRKFRAELERNFAEREMHACFVKMEVDMGGNELLLISGENMLELARMMYDTRSFTSVEMEVISAVREMTNILAVSFTNAMNVIAGVRVLPTPPEHLPDFRSLFKENILFETNPDNNVIMIETEFTTNDRESILYFYILPEQEGFWKLTQVARR